MLSVYFGKVQCVLQKSHHKLKKVLRILKNVHLAFFACVFGKKVTVYLKIQVCISKIFIFYYKMFTLHKTIKIVKKKGKLEEKEIWKRKQKTKK